MGSKEHHEPNPSLEQTLRARVDDGIRGLLGEMQRGKSERLAKYLEFSARFHKYSAHNQLLIYLQCPEATFVAGYQKWREWGYQVAKGEKGIRILAPRVVERDDPETQEKKKITYFVPVSVFDASQLANLSEKPLPTFFTQLSDDQDALLLRLQRAAEGDNIRIEEMPLGLTQGVSRKGRISLREGMDSRSKFLTLLHEYTHEILHWSADGRQQTARVKECHAEAYIRYIQREYSSA